MLLLPLDLLPIPLIPLLPLLQAMLLLPLDLLPIPPCPSLQALLLLSFPPPPSPLLQATRILLFDRLAFPAFADLWALLQQYSSQMVLLPRQNPEAAAKKVPSCGMPFSILTLQFSCGYH